APRVTAVRLAASASARRARRSLSTKPGRVSVAADRYDVGAAAVAAVAAVALAPGSRSPRRGADLAHHLIEHLDAPPEAGDRHALVVAVEHVGEADPRSLLDLDRREAVP